MLGNKTVFIQQDNASPHCFKTDPDVVAACSQDGWDISLAPQPAQSPDFNVLDLGLFRAIQALQQTKKMRSITDIVGAVKDSFNELQRDTLDNTFLTLMSVMKRCLADEDGNRFAVPHSKKAARCKQVSSFAVLNAIRQPTKQDGSLAT